MFELDIQDPTAQSMMEEWWAYERSTKRGKARKKLDTLVCTISYALWKNRNAFVLDDERWQLGPLSLVALITEEYNLIKAAIRAPERGEVDAARE
jgi:hypothetical protein